MGRLRENDHGMLVATDIAARGLDPGVRTIVHYQLPHAADVNSSPLNRIELYDPYHESYDYDNYASTLQHFHLRGHSRGMLFTET
ncbi:DEAD-box ATP-dependent RNA helicase 13-like protein [Quillaja saponaria]|uniref:DEAD-box ATP-dependent RNA helicase 13-like protein n=1 Tax=Quillaja saponaria TaxID=32244 RepID=A0AAD7QE50_QUISA|nr:DEAD-box ATP-dependent RNA helicase 13-like protein [Quillaja saponaria]